MSAARGTTTGHCGQHCPTAAAAARVNGHGTQRAPAVRRWTTVDHRAVDPGRQAVCGPRCALRGLPCPSPARDSVQGGGPPLDHRGPPRGPLGRLGSRADRWTTARSFPGVVWSAVLGQSLVGALVSATVQAHPARRRPAHGPRRGPGDRPCGPPWPPGGPQTVVPAVRRVLSALQQVAASVLPYRGGPPLDQCGPAHGPVDRRAARLDE